MEDINVSKIFQMKNVIDSLPFNLQDHRNIPVTFRNKVFNYKQTIKSIELNFKNPQPLNYSRSKKEIDRAIEEFA